MISMTHIKNALKTFLMTALIWSIALQPTALQAQNAPTVIRDTEIEAMFKEWMDPLLKAANMGPDSVNFILVQSSQVNAFVAGGANIFFYTGLIDKTENPGEVVGVLAHELGHVIGGHLISTRRALEKASYETILGAIIGIGAAIATGNAGAAAAGVTASSSVATRRFLAHTRINESSADQAALRLLGSSTLNPNGLKTFLQKLESDELLPSDQQSEYVRTHPLTFNRIEALETNIAKSTAKNTDFPAHWVDNHARMKAKLIGYVNPGRVPWVYDDRDLSIPARYARAIAAYLQNKIEPALKEIDGLIELEPNNPYFYELKGQMLRDFGRVSEAIPNYSKAVEIMPRAGLIQIDLGHAYLQMNNFDQSIKHLEEGQRLEPRSTRVHRLLATAYGQAGREDIAKLHLAEEAILQRKVPYAKRLAKNALENFKPKSREWIKAKDLLAYIEALESNPNYER